MKTLDKTKPYGEVYGISVAKFEQDGVLFDVFGNEIGGKEEIPTTVEATPEVVKKPGRPPRKARDAD